MADMPSRRVLVVNSAKIQMPSAETSALKISECLV